MTINSNNGKPAEDAASEASDPFLEWLESRSKRTWFFFGMAAPILIFAALLIDGRLILSVPDDMMIEPEVRQISIEIPTSVKTDATVAPHVIQPPPSSRDEVGR